MFERAGDALLRDPRALHEFAHTKVKLAARLQDFEAPADRQARARLLGEAESFLERVTEMNAPALRRAWAWFDLAETRRSPGRPRCDVIVALQHAVELAPAEDRFAAEAGRVRDGAN